MTLEVIIAVKRTIKKYRHSNIISAKAMRELEKVLKNIEYRKGGKAC